MAVQATGCCRASFGSLEFQVPVYLGMVPVSASKVWDSCSGRLTPHLRVSIFQPKAPFLVGSDSYWDTGIRQPMTKKVLGVLRETSMS